jgi:hypothetical protein
MFILNFGGIVILSSVFPPADAIRAFGQVSPKVNLRIVEAKTLCNLPRGTYLFGYDLGTNDGDGRVGRICRDILSGEWVAKLERAGS